VKERALEALEIHTRRLVLTALRAADAPALHEYRSDPDVCRFQSFEPGSLRDVEKWIEGLQMDRFDEPGTWFQFAIRLRDSGQLVGDLGTRFDAEDPRVVEVGFTISPAHQRRGYGTEAVVGALDHLFVSAGKHRVYGSVDPRNRASIALLEKVGMRREAHFRESLWFKGEWVDDVVFGILESEWKQR
jgi:RimJ/RimL family protein N-acetyltransferase